MELQQSRVWKALTAVDGLIERPSENTKVKHMIVPNEVTPPPTFQHVRTTARWV